LEWFSWLRQVHLYDPAAHTLFTLKNPDAVKTACTVTAGRSRIENQDPSSDMAYGLVGMPIYHHVHLRKTLDDSFLKAFRRPPSVNKAETETSQFHHALFRETVLDFHGVHVAANPVEMPLAQIFDNAGGCEVTHVKNGIRAREAPVKDVPQGVAHPMKVRVGQNADPYFLLHAQAPFISGNSSAENILPEGRSLQFFRVYQPGKKTQVIIASFMKTFDR
jgi:hypothetical protein